MDIYGIGFNLIRIFIGSICVF